jgi:hypothetical protein
MKDAAGRIFYIVDLADDAHEGFADVVTPQARGRFDQRHSAKAQNMVAAYEKQYGFEYTDMTSWVGNSFAAYLTQQQVDMLRADSRVVLVSEVIPAEFSTPPWYDSTHASTMPPYYETSSWGRNAVNGNVSNRTRRVYVIDGGVGYHQDLPNVIARVNASCGTNNNGCPGQPVVGCFPHPTHVAGIIGAPYGNKGVAGVDAGAAIISVSALPFPQSPAICSDPALNTTSVATAMDYVKWDLIVNGGYQVGIVNISINSPAFAPGGTLNAKMSSLASQYIGGYVYVGAFVAQSAGNDYQNACQHAFGYSSGGPRTADGIMVVGAIDYLGQPVTPANGGFDNHGLAGNQPGSNYGSCVEVWAPGKEILSTWGPNVPYNPNDSSTWQSQYVTYDEYVKLSGTSMAAPHITGVAAYLAETRGLNSPGDIEAAVRGLFYGTGQWDHDGLAVNLVKLPGGTAAPSIADGSFEQPRLAAGTYVAASGSSINGSPWTFAGTTGQRGLSTNGSAFTAQTVSTTDGNQVAFIQGEGTLSQSVFFSASGSYQVSLKAIQRHENQDPNGIVLSIEVDGVLRWSGLPGRNSYATYSTPSLQLASGSHTITIRGRNPALNDNTVFVDAVALLAAAASPSIADGSFEQPRLAAGTYVAASGSTINGSPWTFAGTTGQRGLSTNGSAFTAQTVSTTDGNQVAFIQGEGTLKQSVSFPVSGQYKVSVKAIQRRENQDPNGITLSIEVDGVSLWSGLPGKTGYTTYSTPWFSLSAGSHTIKIRGTNPAANDNTVFVDMVGLAQRAQ